jgi:hypothetical protein
MNSNFKIHPILIYLRCCSINMIMTCVNYCALCIMCLPAPLLSNKIIFTYHHRYCHSATMLDGPNKNKLPVLPLRAPTHHADPPLPVILPTCFLCFINITTILIKKLYNLEPVPYTLNSAFKYLSSCIPSCRI